MLGDTTQQTIERSLYGSQSAPVKSSVGPSKAQVIANIERLMALSTKNLSHQPSSTVAQEQFDLLRELKDQVVNTDPSAELLADVQKQLDEMSSSSSSSSTSVGSTTAATSSYVLPQTASLETASPALASPLGPAPLASITPVVGAGGPASGIASASASLSSAAPASASELIANLMKVGLLPSSSAAQVPATSEPSAVGAGSTPSQDKAYTDYIMSLDLSMVTADLSKPAPELEILLQEHLPHPCRQCANRYPGGEAGKHSLDDHLDWHFTNNRRARATLARGQSRAWLDPAVRWVRSGFDDVMPTSKDAHQWDLDDPAAEKALREKMAHAFVIVPHGSELASRPCRICKEPFQSEWSEEVEEWIWRNAVLIDGEYYHASCYYSAKSMSDVVSATRLAATAASAATALSATAAIHAPSSPGKAEQNAHCDVAGDVAGDADADLDAQRKRKATSPPPMVEPSPSSSATNPPPHKKPSIVKEEHACT